MRRRVSRSDRGAPAPAADTQAPIGAPGVGAPSVSASSDALPRKNSQLLGEQLLEKGAITAEQLNEALLEQTDSGRRLGEVLVEIGLLDERTLTEVVAEQYGLAMVDLRPVAPAADALELIPEALARGMMAIPTHRDDDRLEVVVADPSHPGLLDGLSQAAGRPVALSVAPASEVRRAIDRAVPRARGCRPPHPGVHADQRGTPDDCDRRSQQTVQADAPGRAGRQPHHHAGRARPRLRRAHRTAGRPGARADAHRRRAARRAHPARRDGARRSSAASRSWRA